jgi:hypothetical protein
MTNNESSTLSASGQAQQSLHRMEYQRPEFELHPTDYEWIDWIKKHQKNGYCFFKFDITFSASGYSRNEVRWLEYFNHKVSYKIRKRIGFSRPILDLIREYEFDIKSRKYTGTDWRCPHHIHSIIGVPQDQSLKMSSHRLKRDVESLPEVSSVHIELIPDNDADSHKTVERAFAYMRKRKTYRPLM